MTVWILNPFDNLPMEGNRPQRYWLMARGFARAGHRVVCWTSDFSHATKKKRVLVRENADAGIDLRMVQTVPYPRNICLKRIISHCAFARDWRRMAEKESERPDLVVASMPPIGSCLAAMEYAKEADARFVADIMDAWPETFYRVAPAWLFAPLRCKVRRIYREADAVSAVAERYIALAKEYGCKAPTHCCNHGIDVGAEVAGKRSDGKGCLRLAYAGAMGASYDLETAIDAVKGLDDVTFDIAGSGPKEASLKERAECCGRIRFHGYLGEDELRELLLRSDVGLVPMFPDSCVGIPYKLADYAAAGLRVAECLGGETESIIARHNAGAHYAPGDAESLRACLRGLMESGGSFDASGFAAEFDAKRIMDGYVKWVQTIL